MLNDETPLTPWSFHADTLDALRLQKAREALQEDNLDEALVEAEEYLARNPEDVDALRIVARAALQLGDALTAREAIEQVLEREPGGAADLAVLALARIESADLRGGLDAARWAVQIAPDLADAWTYQGMALERLGDTGEAALAYRRAHEIDPEAHPLPTSIDEATWEAALERARRSLPGPIRTFYANVPIAWELFPDPAELSEAEPPTSPFVDALYTGTPPLEGDPWVDRPPAVRLFRGNLGRPAADLTELARRIGHALLTEAVDWIGIEETTEEAGPWEAV